MANYAKSAAGALKSIKKAGQAVVLRRTVAGAPDPETSRVGTPTITDAPGYAVLFDYDLRTSGLSQADGTLIQTGDKNILMPASGLALSPVPGDDVLVGGVLWRILFVKELNPAGIPILFDLQARR